MAVVHAKSPDTPAPGYVFLDVALWIYTNSCIVKIPPTRHSMRCSTNSHDGFTPRPKMTWFAD